MMTVPGLFAAWAAERPDDLVARERQGLGRSLTIGELVAGTGRLAAGLAAAGAGPDRPVISWLPNRLEHVQLIAAAAVLGTPVLGLNTRYKADELRHVLQRADAGVLVAVNEFAGIRFGPMVVDAGAGPLQTVVVIGAPDDPAWAAVECPVIGWDDLAVGGPVDHVPDIGDLLVAFTKSGTTGLPKLAVHDQAGVVQHAFDDAAAFDVRPGDRLVLDVPMCGTFGFTSLFAAIAGQATTLIDERFDPDDSARAVADEGVSHYNASDDMLLRVLDTGRVRLGEHAWREGGYANFVNAAVDAAQRVDDVGVKISGSYGSSEIFALLTKWPASMSVEERARPGGIPVGAATELRVVDPESGEDRPVGEEGSCACAARS